MSGGKAESLARVIEAAAGLFAAHGYDEVSISQIAAAARCSSATIYGAFGDKKGLFREALLQRLSPAPALPAAEGPPSLRPLLAYFAGRIQSLASVEVRNLLRGAGVDVEALRSGFTAAVGRAGRLETVVREVRRAMRAGLLRDGDPRDATFLMWAGVGFQPLLYGLVFGDEAGFYPVDILRAVFTPLVTPRGQAELTAYLAELAATSPERPGPSVTQYLRQAGQAAD
jgi:AcrR family transcriptional regulator